MANHKQAEKRARQTKVKTLANKTKKSRAKTIAKDLREAIAAGKKEEAKKLLVKVQSTFGKLGKSSAMNKKTAARKTSRLASQVARM